MSITYEIYPEKIRNILKKGHDTMCKLCPLCNSFLDTKTEYLYNKLLREDCKYCSTNGLEYNYYCNCNNSNNNNIYINKILVCNNCNKCSKHNVTIKHRDFCKVCMILNNYSNSNDKIIDIDDNNIKKLSSLTCKELYIIAKEFKIKYRFTMTKYELVDKLFKFV